MNPAGAVVPISVLHYVPSGSQVNGTVDYTATVSAPAGIRRGAGGDVMTVTEDAWYDEQDPSKPQSLPRAMCFVDKGCSAAVSTKQPLFLSDPPMSVSAGTIPVFSVRQLSDSTWVGTLGAVGSSDTVTTVMEKDDVKPDQQINFSIVSSSGGTGPGVNMYMTDQADLWSENAVMYYSGVATSSQQLASMTLTPWIWKKEPSGQTG